MKTKNTALSEQFQITNRREGKSITLTHKHITTHFPRLVQALLKKVAELNNSKLFGFQIFWFYVYMTKVIPEKRRVH
jgi:hypothetical protein